MLYCLLLMTLTSIIYMFVICFKYNVYVWGKQRGKEVPSMCISEYYWSCGEFLLCLLLPLSEATERQILGRGGGVGARANSFMHPAIVLPALREGLEVTVKQQSVFLVTWREEGGPRWLFLLCGICSGRILQQAWRKKPESTLKQGYYEFQIHLLLYTCVKLYSWGGKWFKPLLIL